MARPTFPSLNSCLDFWRARLSAPVDPSGLAVFRMVFGLIMAWEAWRMLRDGWVQRFYSDKAFYFKYWPFDFVQPWPGDFMYLHVVVMGTFALFLALGVAYRVSASALALMLVYVFLLEKARYLNHMYLACLIAVLMPFIPAHRCWSVDTWLSPLVRSEPVQAWALWLVRFQVAVPMVFGGVAKLNWDWLRGEPLRTWLSYRTEMPLVGPLFEYQGVVWLMVYGALLLDLLFVGYISNRRTRVFGYGLLVVFHLLNDRLWGIGIFPWLMIGATAVFFPPDWPRRVWRDVVEQHPYRPAAFFLGLGLGAVVGLVWAGKPDVMTVGATGLGFAVFAYHLDEPFRKNAGIPSGGAASEGPFRGGWRRRLAVGLLGAWVAFQMLMPLRHYAVPGNVHWTEQGHVFAWHMMLRSKDSHGVFAIYSEQGNPLGMVDPGNYLTPRQVEEMSSRPEMIWQFAQHIGEWAEAEGYGDVGVHASFHAGLNGRPTQPLTDPAVDLTKSPRPVWGQADWILPLTMPLRAGGNEVAARP